MNDMSSRDYARDAEAARQRLSEKLRDLHDGLTPGRVLDEVLTYGKNGGTLFLKALNNAARENPVPAMLVGAGCAMLLAEKSGLTELAKHLADERAADGSGGAATPGAGTKPRHAGHGAKAAGSSLAESMKHGAHDAAEAVGEMGSAAKRGLESAADRIAEAGDRTREQVVKSGNLLRDRADAFMQDQPLVAAAVGLAIGAAIAAVFPATQLEDEVMGETSDAIKETLGEVASEQLETAESIAGAVAQEVRTAAEREGLTPSTAAEAARDLGARVGRVASEAAETATNEVKERVSQRD